MPHIAKHATRAVIAVLTLSPVVAFADDPETENTDATEATWAMSSMETENGDPWGHALITTSANGKDVGFRCWNGNLLAAFALEPVDLMSAFKSAGPQKPVRIRVTLNGHEPEMQTWSLLKRHRVIAMMDQKMTRVLYNTAVRGETVTIDPRHHGDGESAYELPTPDPSAFAAFMEACGFSSKQS